MELINIQDVNVRYKNGVNAIHDLSLKIKKGDFVFVIGGSGSGKSTFIKMLYREIKPSSGKIILGGLNVATDISDRKSKLLKYLTTSGLARFPSAVYRYFENGVSNQIRKLWEVLN